MIATLAMYDRPETAAALDRLWDDVRGALGRGGVDAPRALTREGDLAAQWRSPELVLGQTCGMPYRRDLHQHVQLVGTLDHGLEGCPPGYYRSHLVVRAVDPRTEVTAFDGAALAFNEASSQSGWAAVHAHARALDITLRPAVVSGSHRASARAVAEGRADIAAIDAMSWILMRRHDPFTEELRVIGSTAPTPGLPLVTGRHRDAVLIAEAVEDAIAALSPQDRGTLRLRGLVRIPKADYLALPLPPDPAIS